MCVLLCKRGEGGNSKLLQQPAITCLKTVMQNCIESCGKFEHHHAEK